MAPELSSLWPSTEELTPDPSLCPPRPPAAEGTAGAQKPGGPRGSTQNPRPLPWPRPPAPRNGDRPPLLALRGPAWLSLPCPSPGRPRLSLLRLLLQEARRPRGQLTEGLLQLLAAPHVPHKAPLEGAHRGVELWVWRSQSGGAGRSPPPGCSCPPEGAAQRTSRARLETDGPPASRARQSQEVWLPRARSRWEQAARGPGRGSQRGWAIGGDRRPAGSFPHPRPLTSRNSTRPSSPSWLTQV